nr:hypothetical protein [Butyrivibrio sp. AE3003]
MLKTIFSFVLSIGTVMSCYENAFVIDMHCIGIAFYSNILPEIFNRY